MYRFYAELANAKIITLRYDAAMNFPLEDALDALRPGKSAPQIFFLANPNNPTGTLVSAKSLARMLKAAPRTVVVVDEAYTEFSGLSILRWIRHCPNLVVLRTFSKAAGLAGLRLGCIFANPKLIRILKSAASPFSVNTAALVAAEAAIRDQRTIQQLRRRSQPRSPGIHERARPSRHHVLSQRRQFCSSRFRREWPAANPQARANAESYCAIAEWNSAAADSPASPSAHAPRCAV